MNFDMMTTGEIRSIAENREDRRSVPAMEYLTAQGCKDFLTALDYK